jgi:predicted metalloprotease
MKRILTMIVVALAILFSAPTLYAQSTESATIWTVPTLVTFVSNDLNQFWNSVFETNNLDYQAPTGVVAYIAPARTACGEAQANNAFYCGLSHSIHYDQNFLNTVLSDLGDFAVATVIAHEWGHAIQVQLRLLTRSSVQNELQADCFAGAYAHHAEATGVLEDGDLNEGRNLLAQLGDPNTRFRRGGNRASHGTPVQRVNAFETGYMFGVSGCL